MEVEAEGRGRGCGPGTTLGHVNRVLAAYGRKLGPDPASTDFATVGGVIANNSGGMRCGVVHDSYSTVRALTLLLPSGTLIDTEAPDAEASASRRPSPSSRGAWRRSATRSSPTTSSRTASGASSGSRTPPGYRLCAFLDAETPLEIFRRLVVGSEGTLAFVAEAVFETVPLLPQHDHGLGPLRRHRRRPRSRCPTWWRPGPARSS